MDELRIRLHWLMGLRLVVVTLLLGLSIAFHVGRGEHAVTFYALIALTYAITIVYAGALRFLKTEQALTLMAYGQVGVDLLLETFLVARTGGVESPFPVLYMMTVTLASFILKRRGGLITAGVSAILFGLVTNVQLYGLVESRGWIPPSRLSAPETLYTFGVNTLALVVVGFLSGTLAEQLRRTGLSLVEKEQGLHRLRMFHENVLQSLTSGVFSTNAAGQITSFNRAAQEITGYPLTAVQGRPWGEAFNWQRPEAICQDPATLTVPYRFEAEGRRADGSRVVVGMTLSPLTEDGARTGVVGVFQDLTQVRDLQAEIRRREWLATLGEMSAGMAHEIRNPLAALAGSMQMLRKDADLDETSRRLMDIAVREATRLDAIITEFLMYARPPALNLKDCDLNAVLTEVMDLLRHEAQSRPGIILTARLGAGPMTAQVDDNQLRQVLWNLAMNAFEAMPQGGRLTITTRRRRVGAGTRSGEVIEVAFEDTGEGIKKEDLDKIFLPFFTTKRQGSGLGLAAVHRVVDLHGGWIRVESQEGKGSSFVVCLPRVAEAGVRLWHEGREPWKRS
ncbi:two-component system sensor histidine kinase NtrB [Nitrospira sp. Kam-Ns4a]